jgi:hypothetical protein
MYRVHSVHREGDEFNPGSGSPTRFAFFGDPVVPVLYAADTEAAALSESLLHDVPFGGGELQPSAYRNRRMSRVVSQRELKLAAFLGSGLRRLGVTASQLTATDATEYARTVLWAEAAWRAGLDGIAYMSRLCNADRAYVLFGNRVRPGELTVDGTYEWAFGDVGDGRAALIAFCNVLNVEVHV